MFINLIKIFIGEKTLLCHISTEKLVRRVGYIVFFKNYDKYQFYINKAVSNPQLLEITTSSIIKC